MAQAQTKLTTWQAACIITGYGVGSGIMTLPYLVNRAGIISCIVIRACRFLQLLHAHRCLQKRSSARVATPKLVTMFKKILFVQRKARKGPNRSFFALTVVVLIVNLAAYIAGGAEILQAAGLPPMAPSSSSTLSQHQLSCSD